MVRSVSSFLVLLIVCGLFCGCKAEKESSDTESANDAGSTANASPDYSGEPAYVTVDTANFETDVLRSDKPVLVDFWADWCGPCHVIAPAVGELAHDYKGRITVAKMDVDQASTIAGNYGIDAIPTLILFRDGKEINRITGGATHGLGEFKERVATMMDSALK